MKPLQSFPLDGKGPMLLWVGEINGEHFSVVTTPDTKLRMEGFINAVGIGGRLVDEETGEVVAMSVHVEPSRL